MFRYLRVKSKPEIDEAPTGTIRAEQLEGDSASPIRLGQLNNLPENIKRRLYRGLIPLNLLLQNDIDPITWKDSRGNGRHHFRETLMTEDISADIHEVQFFFRQDGLHNLVNMYLNYY